MLKHDLIFLVIFFAALINDCIACFRKDEHQKRVLPTGISYYEECQCTELGYTIENLMWLDIHNQPIEKGPGTPVYTEEGTDSVNLYIPKVTKSMSGEYKCVTEVEGHRYIQAYIIDAYEPLYFFKTLQDQHLVLGGDSLISCEARGESPPRITWQKEIGDEFVEIILPTAGKYEQTPGGLLIRNVSKEDAGKYKCTALVISTAEEVDRFIDVDVHTVPVIEELQAYPGTTVIAGQSLSVDCLAEGIPTPQYIWTKIETDDTKNSSWIQNVNTINFDSILPEDEGIYECNAYNNAGSSKRLISLEVLVAPNITYFENITEVEGATIQLVCNATGKPEPNITIIYEGWDLNTDWELSEFIEIPNKAFINLDRSHEGVYVCNASNEVGYDLSPTYLTVLHRPYFKDENKAQGNGITEWGYEGKTVKLNCTHTSNPPAVVTWRFESNDIPMEKQIEINKQLLDMHDQYITMNIDANSTYGIYTCTAGNKIGEATKIIILREGFKPPVIETEINITDITATTVTFHIEGPFIKDIPKILGYTAQYDEEWNFEITDIHPNRTWSLERPFKIEKLKPNTTYRVSFAAVNEVGAGEYTDQLWFTTLEKSVPESPVLEEDPVKRSSSGNHLLTWKESADNGEPIDFYVLKYCPVYDELDDKLCEEVRSTAPASELELTDLESNTTYFLELIAHNAEGNSTPANISITIPVLEEDNEPTTQLSGGVIIGISIIIVLLCLVLLDLLLLVWRRQGIIANCFVNKDKRKKDALNSRDKKGLLIVEPVDTRPDNGHKEFEYNKNTGVVTGKHSAV